MNGMNFLDLVKARYSVRSYRPQAVEREKVEYLLECARLAQDQFVLLVEAGRFERRHLDGPFQFFEPLLQRSPCHGRQYEDRGQHQK